MKIESLSVSTEDMKGDMVSISSNAGIERKIPSQTKTQAPCFDKQCYSRELKKLKLKPLRNFRHSRSDDDLIQYRNVRIKYNH